VYARLAWHYEKEMSQHQEYTGSSIAKDIYRKGRSLHDLRLSYVDDSEDYISTSEGKLDNPFLSLTRPEIAKEVQRVPSEYETEHFQLDIALQLLDRAESDAKKALTDDKVVALGYANPSDEAPRLIRSTHWNFLTINFDESTAEGGDLHYVGLRIIDAKDLSDEELKALNSVSDATQSPSGSNAGSSKSDTDNPFSVFREMKNLRWDEIEIELVAGDIIMIRARNMSKQVTYGAFGLIDLRTGKGNLNRSGVIFLNIATKQRATDPQYKKNLSRLRTKLEKALGIEGNPFATTQDPNRHRPIFTLIDGRNKADQRARERAERYQESFEEGSPSHELSGRLTDDLSGKEEEYPFDKDEDAATEWLRKNE